MGTDFFACDECGQTTNDACDNLKCFICSYVFCEDNCYSIGKKLKTLICEECEKSPLDCKCGNNEFTYQIVCKKCRGEKSDDSKLLDFLLKKLKLSKEEIVKEYNEKYPPFNPYDEEDEEYKDELRKKIETEEKEVKNATFTGLYKVGNKHKLTLYKEDKDDEGVSFDFSYIYIKDSELIYQSFKDCIKDKEYKKSEMRDLLANSKVLVSASKDTFEILEPDVLKKYIKTNNIT